MFHDQHGMPLAPDHHWNEGRAEPERREIGWSVSSGSGPHDDTDCSHIAKNDGVG